MDILVVVSILVLIILGFLFIQKSGFVGDILNNNYNNMGCSSGNRVYPSGRVPGSYLGLTEAEKQNLLKDFINNNPNLT